MVSGSISLLYSRCFSPFPHGTGSLSVSQEYLALPDGPGKFIQGFSCPALLRIPLSITSFTYTGLSPSMAPLIQRCSAKMQFCNFPEDSSTLEAMSHYPVCTTETTYDIHTVWAVPRSLATTSGVVYYFLFLRILRCFNSPGLLLEPMYSVQDYQLR